MRKTIILSLLVTLILFQCGLKRPSSHLKAPVLQWQQFVHYVDSFNTNDDELYRQFIENSEAGEFLRTNIPYFECPDKELEKIYYFRWWTFRKHIKQTPQGFVITEFLPDVPWSGEYNTINCPAGHHFYEGRWLVDSKYLKDYALFWFDGKGNPRQYSFWAADAIRSYLLVHPDPTLRDRMIPRLRKNIEGWAFERQDSLETLFWQYDSYDGMELTVSGALMSGQETFSCPSLRPTINSYIYGDLMALAKMELAKGDTAIARKHEERAQKLRQEVQKRLWSKDLQFFSSRPRKKEASLAPVRELVGYVPWYFNLPQEGKGYEVAWAQLLDKEGFKAPFGPTTVEQRHPGFKISYQGHECQWNGPSWPFATTQTLKGMANLLRNYNQEVVSVSDYFDLLKTYAHSHHRKLENGKEVPWIDENLNPFNGDWISRTRLESWENGTWSSQKGGEERGKDYNHSGFCDLIINDLVGVIPVAENRFEINPLVPQGQWDFFCLDHLNYHGRNVTIVWDKTGKKYGLGKGLLVYVDNDLKARRPNIEKVVVEL